MEWRHLGEGDAIMGGLDELFKEGIAVAMSIGLILVVACCMAPIAAVLGATGRRRRKRNNTKRRSSQAIGTREVICLTLVVILLAISLANGTIAAMLSSFLSK